MQIARLTVVITALASLSVPAFADTLRCGSSLIMEGATETEVLQKCGPPQSKAEKREPIMARRPNGSTYQVGTYRQETWRYARGDRQFPAVLTFEAGVLKKLEFEK